MDTGTAHRGYRIDVIKNRAGSWNYCVDGKLCGGGKKTKAIALQCGRTWIDLAIATGSLGAVKGRTHLRVIDGAV